MTPTASAMAITARIPNTRSRGSDPGSKRRRRRPTQPHQGPNRQVEVATDDDGQLAEAMKTSALASSSMLMEVVTGEEAAVVEAVARAARR